ncbi:MmgE/PrpD family protein [Nocardioides zeae]|uniref:2-methylcitrate dehydratase PrpD n=1 Tax=Nocardioides zeae TaxID=1457234 RepID=A0AAJ1U7P8_9ACTN|nr:MmgE/PrpD family protein [Nocardioides zeae]MDQ1105692.1 2-methylcitrate dehydratase PrpD [Nocardioides zeae]
MGLTRDLAAFATAATPSEGAAPIVGRSLVDTVGVAVAGAGRLGEGVLERLLVAHGSPGAGPAFLLSTGERGAVLSAALCNATAAHVLDFDDVSHAVRGHPSAVLIPALLAQSEETDVSGAEFVAAFEVGLQVAAALLAGVGPTHYADGWHATSTFGTIATAAAASRLLRLDEGQAAEALGLAASFAAGSRANFGTMTKPLHAGHAAQWGLFAARAAGAGFTANPDQLESQTGFLRLHGERDVAGALDTLHGPRVLTSDRGLNVKKYPCCYFAHRAIEATIGLRERVRTEDVERIEVTVPPGATAALTFDAPRTGLAAKFSGPFLVASALLDGAVRFATFDAAQRSRADVADLGRRVRWSESATPPYGPPEWSEGYAVVVAHLRGGETACARVDVPRGDCRDPLGQAELWAKFADCVDGCELPGADPRTFFDRLLDLPSSPSVATWAAPA